MMWVDLLGYFAGFFTLFSYVPQVIRSYKTKKVNDISPVMVFSYVISMGLWVIYAVLIGNMPIMITNGIAFFVSYTQFMLIVKYK